jgi:hypothetical protein
MRLSAKLSDRRWFWVLITPVMFFGLMPRETGNEFLLKIQRISLLPYFVSFLSLLAWLAYRQHLSKEVSSVQVNWWLATFLDLLKGTFMAFMGLIMFGWMDKVYDRNPVVGYSLQAALVLAVGYMMWRVVYWRPEKN